jgi:hypothetical protein
VYLLVIRPFSLHAFFPDSPLEIAEPSTVIKDRSRSDFPINSFDNSKTGCFTDTPFNRMQAITAIGDVGGTDIFIGWQEIFHSLWDKSTQGNLEW